MAYLVMFEIEKGEIAYSTGKSSFTTNDDPKVFDTLEEAEKEAKKWNTGRVVQHNP